MAENDNTPPEGEGNTRVDIVTLICEIQILFEAVIAALDSIKNQSPADPVAEQLGVIQRLASQAIEALQALDVAIQGLFKFRSAT